MKQGKAITTDGPFAETKEQLAGYDIVEAKGQRDDGDRRQHELRLTRRLGNDKRRGRDEDDRDTDGKPQGRIERGMARGA
jgi:hypothetical protein